MDRFLELLSEELKKELQLKTGWGRNEIMTAFHKASLRAMIQYAKEKKISLD